MGVSSLGKGQKLATPVKDFLKIAGIVLLLFVVGYAICARRDREKNIIREWAEANDYQIVSIEATVFDHGPFWLVDDDDQVYRVVVNDSQNDRVTYFWFGLFGHEQKWSN